MRCKIHKISLDSGDDHIVIEKGLHGYLNNKNFSSGSSFGVKSDGKDDYIYTYVIFINDHYYDEAKSLVEIFKKLDVLQKS